MKDCVMFTASPLVIHLCITVLGMMMCGHCFGNGLLFLCRPLFSNPGLIHDIFLDCGVENASVSTS